MLELLAYLRDNGFTTYIVSGGEQEFMRPWAQRVYGIPPEHVIGTMFKTRFTTVAGTPVIERLAAVDSIDDGPESQSISKDSSAKGPLPPSETPMETCRCLSGQRVARVLILACWFIIRTRYENTAMIAPP